MPDEMDVPRGPLMLQWDSADSAKLVLQAALPLHTVMPVANSTIAPVKQSEPIEAPRRRVSLLPGGTTSSSGLNFNDFVSGSPPARQMSPLPEHQAAPATPAQTSAAASAGDTSDMFSAHAAGAQPTSQFEPDDTPGFSFSKASYIPRHEHVPAAYRRMQHLSEDDYDDDDDSD